MKSKTCDWPSVTVKKWDELEELLSIYHSFDDYFGKWSFRGQPKSEYTLAPALTRLLKEHGYNRSEGIKIEKLIFRELSQRRHMFPDLNGRNFKFGQFILDCSRLQHYGCPTRALDWSSSPYVALYFAVNQDFDSDGALFIFNSYAARRSRTELNDCRNEAFYWSEIDSDFFDLFYMAECTRRLSSQQGSFTFAQNIDKDHYSLIYQRFEKLGDLSKSNIFKIIIDKNSKMDFLFKLCRMNIRPDILMPDTFGFTQYLKDQIIIRKIDKSRLLENTAHVIEDQDLY